MIANTVPLTAHYPSLNGGVSALPVVGWTDSPSPLREVDPVVVDDDGARRIDSDRVMLLPTGQALTFEQEDRLEDLLLEAALEEIRESPLLAALTNKVDTFSGAQVDVYLSNFAALAGMTPRAARAELTTHIDTLALAGYHVELDGVDGSMVTVTPLSEETLRAGLAGRVAAPLSNAAQTSRRARGQSGSSSW